MKISAQGFAVLRTLAAVEAYELDCGDETPEVFPAGELTVVNLVRCIRRPGTSTQRLSSPHLTVNRCDGKYAL
jgi:hypothetical protein